MADWVASLPNTALGHRARPCAHQPSAIATELSSSALVSLVSWKQMISAARQLEPSEADLPSEFHAGVEKTREHPPAPTASSAAGKSCLWRLRKARRPFTFQLRRRGIC